ncbi:MAG TPA: DUF447 family protein [Methanosarcina sp.]|mgnify:FL=1|uniref:DUF447 family protein n=1 Tax=Methanosarcina flavescens TaxID=1715806 RepID=A0A660HQN4_9EURY|nr:DUF447 domain-containing protein [Methanosarcina flavescens]AYK14564.1 DUF447 family protein [Methanosarcina flavescens]NLK33001.1 DUF447 family protein [Methanosarcina flavescens]HII80700.1 DUF447 family protein [Methanosarcina sp.]
MKKFDESGDSCKPDIDLSEYGILEGISETIVSTGLDTPNAAPIGIIRKNQKIFVRIFKGSHTGENLVREGVLVANVVYDPLLLVRSTFFDIESSEFDFVDIGGKKFPVLKSAISWVAFRCTNIKNTEQTVVSDLIPLGAGFFEANRRAIPAPNRGFNAVLEAAVHATRYKLTGDKKYLEWIMHYESLASRCGGEGEKKAMKLLYEVLGL